MPEVVIPEVVYLSTLRIIATFFDEGQEHLVFAVDRSLAAAGDVVVAGNLAGGMPSWCCEELGFSVVDDALRVLSFLSFPIHRSFLQR